MQAGEIWWRGREDQLSAKLDEMAPACLSIKQVALASLTISGATREGVLFDRKPFDDAAPLLVYFGQWKLSMEATIAATESTVRAQAAVDKLKSMLVDFRGTVKNDLSSMKAASERVQNEVLQMQDKYRQAQNLLTSPEFMQAIQNAERMATALRAIQELTETKVSVAIFGGGKGH